MASSSFPVGFLECVREGLEHDRGHRFEHCRVQHCQIMTPLDGAIHRGNNQLALRFDRIMIPIKLGSGSESSCAFRPLAASSSFRQFSRAGNAAHGQGGPIQPRTKRASRQNQSLAICSGVAVSAFLASEWAYFKISIKGGITSGDPARPTLGQSRLRRGPPALASQVRAQRRSGFSSRHAETQKPADMGDAVSASGWRKSLASP